MTMITLPSPSGTFALINIKDIRACHKLQRDLDLRHVNKIAKDWSWPDVGVLTVHSWETAILKYLSKKERSAIDFDPKYTYHESNGHHRKAAADLVFPTGYYTEEHEKAGLIPNGSHVNMPVLLPCLIVETEPVVSFKRLNICKMVSSADDFKAMIGGNYPDEVGLYRLFVDVYKIKVVFGDRNNRGKKNSTGSAHTLLKFWKVEATKPIVNHVLDIITTTYKDGTTIDPTALSYSFMLGLAEALATCLKMGYSLKNIRRALDKARRGDWAAFAIGRHCLGTGSGVSKRITRDLLIFLVKHYMENGKAPMASEVDVTNLIFPKV
jgi:hypothetical protein